MTLLAPDSHDKIWIDLYTLHDWNAIFASISLSGDKPSYQRPVLLIISVIAVVNIQFEQISRTEGRKRYWLRSFISLKYFEWLENSIWTFRFNDTSLFCILVVYNIPCSSLPCLVLYKTQPHIYLTHHRTVKRPILCCNSCYHLLTSVMHPLFMATEKTGCSSLFLLYLSLGKLQCSCSVLTKSAQ